MYGVSDTLFHIYHINLPDHIVNGTTYLCSYLWHFSIFPTTLKKVIMDYLLERGIRFWKTREMLNGIKRKMGDREMGKRKTCKK